MPMLRRFQMLDKTYLILTWFGSLVIEALGTALDLINRNRTRSDDSLAKQYES